jgi:hypothetical protein
MPHATDESLERAAVDRPRREIETALYGAPGSILIIGPSERMKRLLLESFWLRPPQGFAPIPVPCRGSTADRIAAQILEITRTGPVGNAESALARMMRTQSIRGSQPLLLVDDLDALSLTALSRLRSIADGSRVEVRWIAAGSGSRASDHVVGMLPQPVRVVALDVSLSLRAESAITPPKAANKPRRPVASSEPAAIPREVEDPRPPPVPSRKPEPTPMARETNYTPIRARTMAPRRSALPRRDVPSAPPSSPSRAPRRPHRPLFSKRVRAALVGAVIAGAALVLLAERGPRLWERVTQVTDVSAAVDGVGGGIRRAVSTATSLAAESWKSVTDSVATAGSHEESQGRLTAESTADVAMDAVATAEDAAQTARDVSTGNAHEEPPLPDVAAEAREPDEPAAPAAAPIQVGINSDPWSNVAVDGVDFGSTPLSIELSPGPHRFRAEMADGRIIEKEIEVAEGRDEVVFR